MTDQNINLNQQDDIEVAGETVSGIEADADLRTDTATEDIADFEDITIEEDAEARENTAPDTASKVAKLKAEIEKLKAEKQQYLDNWQRDKAEFVNARKRDEESKSDFLKFAGITFAEDLLPVIDSFEAALKHEGSKEGVELIYTQFKSVLKRQGVEEFGTIGESFDPSFHQAIGNEPTEDKAKDHTVADVLQKGYKIHNRVIRPAFVKVFQA